MQTVIIVIHLMVVLAMIGVVLLQKSEGGGLGIGSTGGFLTSRGTANVLTRTTAILAGTFFVTSLFLSVIAGVERRPTTIVNPEPPASGTPTPPTGSPAPNAEGGLLKQLETGGGPPAPPGGPGGGSPPSEPQVPSSR
jgi:preprotein translocase subunit SecG